MNTEDSEFERIEREALRREAFQRKVDNAMRIAFEAAWDDDDTQVYVKPWVGLTAEDLAQIESDEFWQVGNHMAIAMAVEAKLKEKNNG